MTARRTPHSKFITPGRRDEEDDSYLLGGGCVILVSRFYAFPTASYYLSVWTAADQIRVDKSATYRASG